MQTGCGHIFHFDCFSSWVRNKMICPVDRNNFNKNMT
jgi:hypothetical protein